ncbi:MAG: GDP-mannose dehydrogenase [Acidobacteria bacterium]|nr:MAG: GDP-mannose dehydrogenase [Acidobacteriota bacterium]
MRISIFGMGYVGAVTAACFAQDGHQVVGIDIDPSKLAMLKAGQSPIIEDGLSELIVQAVQSGRLRVTQDGTTAVHETEASLVCVGTPSRRNGSLDTSVVCQVATQIGSALKEKKTPHLVIVRSTMLPGTVNNTIVPLLHGASGKHVDADFDVCFNPEFLREGTSLKDFYNPPFTVVGARQPQVASRVQPLYQRVQAPFLTTTVETAEMIKCTCNTFHALKIAFANEIGNLCKAMNIDSHEVMRIFCSDSKLNISPTYLKPGFAFGGSCLPKDLRALEYQATMLAQALPVIRAILPSNALQIERAVEMVLDTGKRRVGMMGLSFKPGTDDLRESPLVVLAERLLGKGLELKIYDSNVSLAKLIGANKRYIEHEIPHLSRLMVSSLEELFQRTEVIVVGNRAPEFAEALQRYTSDQFTVIDLARIIHNSAQPANYHGICW